MVMLARMLEKVCGFKPFKIFLHLNFSNTEMESSGGGGDRASTEVLLWLVLFAFLRLLLLMSTDKCACILENAPSDWSRSGEAMCL
jgi:hypothetical protein